MTRAPYGGGGLDAAVRVADGSLGDADRTVVVTRERATPAGSWRSGASSASFARRASREIVAVLCRRLVLQGSGARLGIREGTVMSGLYNARRKAAEATRGDPL